MSTAAVLLAVALLIGPGPSAVRARAGTALRAQRLRPGLPVISDHVPDPLAVASSFDVLAVCLAAGMAVSTAAAVTAASAPPKLARVLRRGADLLALGADSAVAWSISPEKTMDGDTFIVDEFSEIPEADIAAIRKLFENSFPLRYGDYFYDALKKGNYAQRVDAGAPG